MAIVNLLMFVCFGFISLVNAYDFFNNNHVPYMIEQLAKANEETKETKQDSGKLQPEADRVEEQNPPRAEEVQETA